MRWVEHIAHMRRYELHTCRLERLTRKYISEDQGVEGKIILKLMEGNNVRRYGLDSSGAGQEQVAGSCDHGNESSDSITDGSFLD
jgi:hypothetical protein